MSTIKIIGKTTLGELGFCPLPRKMGDCFTVQLRKIQKELPQDKDIAITSMTNYEVIEKTGGIYVPKVRLYCKELRQMFEPEAICKYCKEGLDSIRPSADFIVCKPEDNIVLATFSREAPILAFSSENGSMALGAILTGALEKYADYLFKSIKKGLGAGKITATMVTFNYYHPKSASIIQKLINLTSEYSMELRIMQNSEDSKECYHRGETGNHVVAMW